MRPPSRGRDGRSHPQAISPVARRVRAVGVRAPDARGVHKLDLLLEWCNRSRIVFCAPHGLGPELWSGAAPPDAEELRRLVVDGLEKGFLTYDEIAAALEDVGLTREQSEDFYSYLVERSIDLVEGEQHKQPPQERPAHVEDETKAPPKLDVTVEPSLDSLRLYLREIGKVPLLTADREVYLA